MMGVGTLRGAQEIALDGGKIISNDAPAFIVAEAACNHMCDMELARKMIDKAAEAGADGIKFQTYKAEKLVTRKAVAFWGKDKISQMEYYKRLDRFGKKHYADLFQYAREKGIVGFSSVFDRASADMLAELDMPVFKIASCEIPNLRFIRHVAGFGRPIMLATGASTPDEIDRAIESVLEQGNDQLLLMACTLCYPTPHKDANYLRIQTLKKRYPGFLVGISDHTEPDRNMAMASVAVALGAKVVEKHYTLDRSMTGSGHFFAVDPGNLRELVYNVRMTEAVLGDGKLGVSACEKKAWHSARRSIVAEVPIKKGQTIDETMLGTKRPADGLSASMLDDVIGKRARQDIQPDQKISLEMLED
jgi:sialic acid synthase SpsE